MTALIVIIVIIVILAAAAGAFWVLGRRDTSKAIGTLSSETKARDRSGRASEALATTQGAELEPWVPPTADQIGINRRQFLNRGILVMSGLGVAGFGTGLISFLWPTISGGFGSKIVLGKVSDLKAKIQAGNGFYYLPEGKLYVTDFPATALSKAKSAYQASELVAMEAGVTVLYQKCPHLGCKVPPCLTSQWFECPCHGSQYTQVGEKKAGPAPRGMDHFATSMSGNVLTADTGTIVQGPPIGTDTTGQEPAGPHCVSGGE